MKVGEVDNSVDSESCSIEVFDKQPEDFRGQLDLVAFYLFVGKELFLLQNRADLPHYGSMWTVPVERVSENESMDTALVRKMESCLGVTFKPKEAQVGGTLFFRNPFVDYRYNCFYKQVEEVPSFMLGKEFAGWKLVSHEEIKELTLLPGAKTALTLLLKRVEIDL